MLADLRVLVLGGLLLRPVGIRNQGSGFRG